jgi:peptidoglycan/LPS O-acetylase OafA/YrhL
MVAEGLFLVAVHGGMPPAVAAGVFRPTTIAWFLVAVTGLYTLSLVTTAGWRPGGRARRVLAYASDRSFGIFLAHPLVLAGLLWAVGGRVSTAGLAVLYVGTVVGSVLVADVLRRLPVSAPLTGRPWSR